MRLVKLAQQVWSKKLRSWPSTASVRLPARIAGELAAVLAAYANGRVTSQNVQAFYTDSWDTGGHLHKYVESGRPAHYGTLLATLTAPFMTLSCWPYKCAGCIEG